MKFRVWDEKFNCWDKSYKQFYPGEEMVKQGKIIQFSTGLHDESGIDIYDGDIVIGYDLNERKRVVSVIDLNLPFGILYLQPSRYNSWMSGDDWHAKTYSIANERSLKIIGNIFENPKLLA